MSSPFFTDEDLDEFAELDESTRQSSALVKRSSGGFVSDGHGGSIPDFQTVATILVKVDTVGDTGSETVIGGQVQSISDVIISMPIGTDIRVGDRVEVTTVGAITTTYEVASVTPPRTWEVRRKVYARVAS